MALDVAPSLMAVATALGVAPKPGILDTPAVIREVTALPKIEPSPAIPVAVPTWRKVELIPEATPALRGWTTPTAVLASGGLTIPMPMPVRMKPRIRWVQPVEAPIPAISHRPSPTSNMPGPIRSFTGILVVSRPVMLAVTRMAPEIIARRKPAPSALQFRTFCR
jgi:hypothetical protein